MRHPSEKSKKEYARLRYETKDQINFLGHHTWGWANNPLQKETLNLLLDIKFLVVRDNLQAERSIRKFNNSYEDESAQNVRDIILKHIEDRIATYKEI